MLFRSVIWRSKVQTTRAFSREVADTVTSALQRVVWYGTGAAANRAGRDVAGKTADFLVTLKQIEASHLPELTDELAKSLGVAGSTVQSLRDDIEKNLSREVKARLMARNKQTALDALVAKAELDLPQSIVQAEIDRLVQGAREDRKSTRLNSSHT